MVNPDWDIGECSVKAMMAIVMDRQDGSERYAMTACSEHQAHPRPGQTTN